MNSTLEIQQVETPQTSTRQVSRTATTIATFVSIIQAILFMGHWFVYKTLATFRVRPNFWANHTIQAAFFLLSISFISASLLTHRYSNALVRAFYKFAALWMGLLNFLFLASIASWLSYFIFRALGLRASPLIGNVAFGTALIAFLYGIVNARWIRLTRIAVKLPNLPASWRGRVAALVSDIHLGPVNGKAFMQRIVAKLSELRPDVVFIAGDMYDGTKVNAHDLASPWRKFSAPFGTYFVTGNHEEFGDPRGYLDAVEKAGIRVLDNEKVSLEGLQVVGVNDHDLRSAEHLRAILQSTDISPNRASILLAHTPNRLAVAEEAGISLQLSGHTHGGQIFPWTWFTQRIFGRFTYGLSRFGEMMTYTSYGVGTWGPQLRVGTKPEIVLIEFA